MVNWQALEQLQVGKTIEINGMVLTIVYTQPYIGGTELYLKNNLALEFMLQIPQDKSLEGLQFYKVFRHDTELMFRIVGFQKKIIIRA